jgi:RimJ/RimL family protein N-acetyltransferase
MLCPIGAEAAEAILAGRKPEGVAVAEDYPTEFSVGVAGSVGNDQALGPFFIQRSDDEVVVGEIGAAFVEEGTIEIGYAIVESMWGRGLATAAVRALLERARRLPEADRVIAHTPLDRPASGRVLEKAGMVMVGQTTDVHEGETLDVQRWELRLRPQP